MALNNTMDILTARNEDTPADIPVSDPSGGLITTDYAEVITLLANRVSALETAVSELQRPAPTPTNPAPEPPETDTNPEPEPPTETETETETTTTETDTETTDERED